MFSLNGGLDRIDEDDIRHDREDRRIALSLSRIARQVGWLLSSDPFNP